MHNPGPWEVDDSLSRHTSGYESGQRSIVSADGLLVAITSRGDYEGLETRLANVALICAAPDLLYALKAMMSAFTPGGDWAGVPVYELAREAVELAEGNAVNSASEEP